MKMKKRLINNKYSEKRKFMNDFVMAVGTGYQVTWNDSDQDHE
jgi:hypothetical protein